MKLKHMFKKPEKKASMSSKEGSKRRKLQRGGPAVPEGLLKKCNHCKSAILVEEVEQENYTCPLCHSYFRMPAFERISMLCDEGSFEEWQTGLMTNNPLEFPGYENRLIQLRNSTGLDEAVTIGKAKIEGEDVVLGVCDGAFLMGSMGGVMGEKITLSIERAIKESLPIILYACSGGARMQEGITSLMQMAKTSAAIKRHSEAGLLFISVLTDPTMGGVTASFAMLGDIILAEPEALIGFAGPRVIEQTIGQKLPKGFQKAEFLLSHGYVDAIVARNEQRSYLSRLLSMHQPTEKKIIASNVKSTTNREMPNVLKKPWERVELSRKLARPVGSDYINGLLTDFVEFHGDRLMGEDHAILGGVGLFNGLPITVIAQEKGKSTKEQIERNFGMPSPSGYRKAIRLAEQAEKFGRPILFLVDTPGAFCGIEAEENGIGEAIARCLFRFSDIKVPILSILIGEGGSGGALAFAMGNEVWMLENSVYSILSPEGYASILWKDAKRAKEAAKLMKMTATDLCKQGIVEKVIAEPEDYKKETMQEVLENIEIEINTFLEKYNNVSENEIVSGRRERFRKM